MLLLQILDRTVSGGQVLIQVLNVNGQFLFGQFGVGYGLFLLLDNTIEGQQLVVKPLERRALLLKLLVSFVVRRLIKYKTTSEVGG